MGRGGGMPCSDDKVVVSEGDQEKGGGNRRHGF